MQQVIIFQIQQDLYFFPENQRLKIKWLILSTWWDLTHTWLDLIHIRLDLIHNRPDILDHHL
jgi:hypothetical protein